MVLNIYRQATTVPTLEGRGCKYYILGGTPAGRGVLAWWYLGRPRFPSKLGDLSCPGAY